MVNVKKNVLQTNETVAEKGIGGTRPGSPCTLI